MTKRVTVTFGHVSDSETVIVELRRFAPDAPLTARMAEEARSIAAGRLASATVSDDNVTYRVTKTGVRKYHG